MTREEILRSLLRKRAAAASAGLVAMEAQLREQIKWALPVRRPEGEARDAEAIAPDPPALPAAEGP